VSLAELEASIEHSDNSIYTAKGGIINERAKSAISVCTFASEIVPTVSGVRSPKHTATTGQKRFRGWA